MAKFLDSYPFSGVTEESLRETQTSLSDEFGAKRKISYSAPGEDAVRKHHDKLGTKLDWVTDVNTTA